MQARMILKNIIIINDYGFIEGGASQVAISSAIKLASLDYNVTLFCGVLSDTKELKFNNLNIVSTKQYDILADPNRLRAIFNGVWNSKSARILSELLDRYDCKYTIIHIHTWTKALSSSVVNIAFKKKFKIVFSLHDYFSVCPNGGFFNFKKNCACNLKPLSIPCLLTNCDVRSYPQKLWRSMRQYVQQHYGKLPSGIRNFIFLSDFSEKILKEYMPDNANIFRINNPIEVSKHPPTDVGNQNTFVYLGRLAKEKGPLLAAEAAVKNGCPIIFVGDGPCKSKIKEIYPSAKVTGWVSKDEVINNLKKSRALVFPTLLYEVQPLSVLEAAALGVPAIVPAPSAACDSVIDRQTGLWFKSGDLCDLCSKMKEMEDPKLAARLGLAAYNKFWAHPPTMGNHISEIVDVYNKVLSE